MTWHHPLELTLNLPLASYLDPVSASHLILDYHLDLALSHNEQHWVSLIQVQLT